MLRLPAVPRRGGGFTLVELLVVIAVIMILSAILLPVETRATRAARDAECISNLRQVHFAFHGYLIQTKGIFPPHKNVGGGAPYWFDHVLPYLGQKRVYGCPILRKWRWQYNPHLLGYGYNAYWLGLWWHTDVAPSGREDTGRYSRFWRSVDEVKNPAKCCLVGDTPRKPDGHWSSSLWWPNSHEEGVDTRHNGGGMVAFCDGHAKKMYPRDMNDDQPWVYDGGKPEVRGYYDPLRPRGQ